MNRYKCPYDGCGKRFASRGGLINHKRCHEGVKPFACKHAGCASAFTCRGNLIRHERRHTGERKYTCSFDGCSAAFANQDNLVRHEDYHRNERKYVCETCGSAFNRPDDLRKHQSVHSEDRPYSCTVADCGATFKTRDNLRTHSTVHTEDRPYKCTVADCGAAFKTNNYLKSHEKLHTDRTYDCIEAGCSASFKQKPNMMRHFHSIHTVDGSRRQKRSEQATANALTRAGIDFKREHRTQHNCLAATWSMTDYLIVKDGCIIDVENDESQHDAYGPACETSRMLKIYTCRQLDGCNMPQLFIRFNPDAYRIDGKTKSNGSHQERRRSPSSSRV